MRNGFVTRLQRRKRRFEVLKPIFRFWHTVKTKTSPVSPSLKLRNILGPYSDLIPSQDPTYALRERDGERGPEKEQGRKVQRFTPAVSKASSVFHARTWQLFLSRWKSLGSNGRLNSEYALNGRLNVLRLEVFRRMNRGLYSAASSQSLAGYLVPQYPQPSSLDSLLTVKRI